MKYLILKEWDLGLLATRIDDLAFNGWQLMGPVTVTSSGNLISPFFYMATMCLEVNS